MVPTTNRDALERVREIPAEIRRVMNHRARALASIATSHRHGSDYQARLRADADAAAVAHLEAAQNTLAGAVANAESAIARSVPEAAERIRAELDDAQQQAQAALDDALSELEHTTNTEDPS